MPGQPIIRNQIQKLESLTEDEQEQLIEDFASGKTLKELSRQYKVGFRAFYGWLDLHPDLKAAWNEAKRYRAQVYAEESHEIADEVQADPDHIAKAALRIKVRQWLAMMNDPQSYGKSPATAVTVNLLHLEAVQQINAADTAERMKSLERPAEEVVQTLEAAPPVDDLAGLLA